MALQGVLRTIANAPEVKPVLSQWRESRPEQIVYNLTSSSKIVLAASLAEAADSVCLYVTADWARAENLASQAKSYLGDEAVSVLPPLEIMPFGVHASSPELARMRLKTFDLLLSQRLRLIVAPVASLMLKTAPADDFRARSFKVTEGDAKSLAWLSDKLLAGGYKRQPIVEEAGTFSIRGGIIDIFPSSSDTPLRLDLLGDVIESIRSFDPVSQRSLQGLEEAVVTPAKEMYMDPSKGEAVAERISSEMKKANLPDQARASLKDRAQRHVQNLKDNVLFDGIEQHSVLFYPELSLFFDYLPEDAMLLIDEPARVREGARVMEKSINDTLGSAIKEGKSFPWQYRIWGSWHELFEEIRGKGPIYVSGFARSIPGASVTNMVHAQVNPVLRFVGQQQAFLAEINRLRSSGKVVLLMSPNEERARHMAESLRNEEIPAAYVETINTIPPSGSVISTLGAIEAGFNWDSTNLVIYGESDVRGRVQKPRRAPRPDGVRVRALPDLSVGDFVVHANHGIGIYMGMRTLEIDGVQRDYVFLQYSGDDALYVPTDQLDRIFKFTGAEGAAPRINRLGGHEWARVKKKASESVRKMARELLEIYATRQGTPGYGFCPDTPWQKEFEDAFKYQETPDQINAVKEVKKDMEAPRPMDRLICGDVGYGKTEVAIRAAFKAAVDGKQTAFLVPTTILAMQHFSTFRERFEGYPVSIEVLSRFRTQKEQADIVERLANGKIDIIIGTHRLLQEDISFKDLGLLMIDEEHRFGVAHKERLKRFRSVVDVLTLSATPIPRTLHMAMGGIRDMSVIETPPEDRFPVQTYVVEYDSELIRQALKRETDRGGQVFYVHNRVQTIEKAARKVESLLPEARCAVAHGQMKEEALERSMLDFLDHRFDVLVCTTIIESGLDIANVNTMIIEDAGNLGLAQLYQLRGRVGRSNRVAHAYLTYRKDHLLTETAEKRLEAIKEFTELGSGFKIALRDMEIRGAGNILGPEQHGFITSVGFDMYLRLLDQAVKEIKGEARKVPPQTVIDMPVDAYIPSEYIPDPRQKIEIYKRVAEIQDVDEVKDLQEEMVDRFGALPEPVMNLMGVALLRLRASEAGVKSIMGDKRRVTICWRDAPSLPADVVRVLGSQYRRRAYLSAGRRKNLLLRTEGFSDREVLEFVDNALDRLGYVLGRAYDKRPLGSSKNPIQHAGKNE